jgi:hypothetical protein
VSNTYGVGTFNPWLNPSTVDNSYLANMITKYNGGVPTADGETYTVLQGSLTPNPLLPTSPGLSGNVSVGGGPLSFNINLGPTGAGDYLVAGWDGPEGIHAVYYIHGLTGTIDLVNDVPGDNDKRPTLQSQGPIELLAFRREPADSSGWRHNSSAARCCVVRSCPDSPKTELKQTSCQFHKKNPR